MAEWRGSVKIILFSAAAGAVERGRRKTEGQTEKKIRVSVTRLGDF